MSATSPCPVCSSPVQQGLDVWHFACPSCGYEFSTLEPAIRSRDSAVSINETQREAGLRDLRRSNFQILTDQMAFSGLAPDALVLDVGAAHGWFLKALSARGYRAWGIEPDQDMASSLRNSGQNIYEGFFPDDLPPGELYDAITFNDVFEHLPHIDAVARRCLERLKPGGLLLINSPNTGGAFYRIAKISRLAGLHFLWDRVWQKGMPSPHLSYFSIASLLELTRRTGFSELVRFTLPVDQAKGSWNRIRYTGMAFPVAALIWVALLIVRPILRLLPADNVAFIFRK